MCGPRQYAFRLGGAFSNDPHRYEVWPTTAYCRLPSCETPSVPPPPFLSPALDLRRAAPDSVASPSSLFCLRAPVFPPTPTSRNPCLGK